MASTTAIAIVAPISPEWAAAGDRKTNSRPTITVTKAICVSENRNDVRLRPSGIRQLNAASLMPRLVTGDASQLQARDVDALLLCRTRRVAIGAAAQPLRRRQRHARRQAHVVELERR